MPIIKLPVGKNCTFDAKFHRVAAKPVTKFLVSYQTCVGVGAPIWIKENKGSGGFGGQL